MDLSWTVDRADGASLVRCRIRNDEAVPRRVRVESRFDAPVLPPRRAGVPADGWDGGGVTLRIGPDERRGFGFAVPAPPVDPPVEIAEVEPADPDQFDRGVAGPPDSDDGDGPTAVDALRDLAEHRPPRAAVGGDREVDDRRVEAAWTGDARDPDERDDIDGDGIGGDGDDVESDGVGDEPRRAPPDALGEWFAAVEARIDRAERLTDADVATATEAVVDAGGVEALAALDDRTDADAERLRTVSERAASLAERAEATDVPVGALERLA